MEHVPDGTARQEEKQDKEYMKITTLNHNQIMDIAKRQGFFSLSWHYRVDGTRNNARDLQKKGLLKLKSSSKGMDIWELSDKKIITTNTA